MNKVKYQNSEGLLLTTTNPFVSEMLTTINQGHKITGFATTKRDVVDPNTGELMGEVAITGFKKTLDRDEFVKIFSNSVYEIFDCSKRARDVFAILLKKGEYNSDKVYFTHEVAQDEYQYKKNNQHLSLLLMSL